MKARVVMVLACAALTAFGAYCGDAAAPAETPRPAVTACPPTQTACPMVPGYSEPTPEPVSADALRILRADRVVSALIAGRTAGSDYWMLGGPRPAAPNERGELPATTVIAFAGPISYAGPVPRYSDPCSGHSGDDERVPPGDPCRSAPRQYSDAPQDIVNMENAEVYVTVDFARGQVVDIFFTSTEPASHRDFIAYLGKYYDGSY